MAASVISRATWTDDSGSGTDGTIINNARLQADIYDKIDAMFAGSGSYVTFEFGGSVRIDGNLTVVGSLTNASAPVTLLKANSGTDTSVGATNVDTQAISGLTAKDQLLVQVWAESVTQQTADLNVYSSTDSINLAAAAGLSAIALGEKLMASCLIMQSQNSATALGGYTSAHSSVLGIRNNIISPAPATAWTGSWTLALRHAGVTAGGTLRWRWAVYKIAGQ